MNYQSSTIKDCVKRISNGEYAIPAIQREFVWSIEQIEALFDSLMQGFPISSFLFWEVDKENIEKFKFYKFIKNYHNKNNRYNDYYDDIDRDKIIAILDGQQRLTSLYIALKGSYAIKTPYKNEYLEKELYFNLLSGQTQKNSTSEKYEFRFLTADEAQKYNEQKIEGSQEEGVIKKFFKVKEIFDLEKSSQATKIANKFFSEMGVNFEIAQDNLTDLYNLIHEEKVINFHLEQSRDLDKVLQIFVRINSGGTKLSHSDLLMSIATADWKNKDARQEIQDLIRDTANDFGFKISKDFILKSCLFLCNLDVKFNVQNFNKENMQIIESNWDNIKGSIKILFETLRNIGLREENIKSYNALIPVIYYIYKNDNPRNFSSVTSFKNDRELIYKWIVRTTIKQTFSGQSDSVLSVVRDVLKENNKNGFPLNKIAEKIKTSYPNKSIIFENDEDYKFIFDFQYAKSETYLILALLYSGSIPNIIYHQDHIFAKNKFTNSQLDILNLSNNDKAKFKEKMNSLANIQLLPRNENQSKSDKDFEDWLLSQNDCERNASISQHYIPTDVEFTFENFLQFIEKRENLLLNKLKELI